MLFKEQLKIVELFRLQPFTEITLQEIMQKLNKKSYNWTYLAVQKLAKKRILETRKIGKTIVARLNLENPETLAHLTYSENLKSIKRTETEVSGAQKSKAFLAKIKENKKIIDDIKQITPFFTLLENKEGITVITESENKKEIEKLKNVKAQEKSKDFSGPQKSKGFFRVLTKEEFKKLLIAAGENRAKDLVKDHLVLYGVEIYYAILLEAYRHGIR